jgi:hypothetical protein
MRDIGKSISANDPGSSPHHELKAEWRFRVIYERNIERSMEMSFFVVCPFWKYVGAWP